MIEAGRSSFRISVCLAVGFAAVASAATDDRPPNILLILADDVGVDAIGCYGGTSYPTDRIDSLGNDGMRFTHCYSMPVCHPTRTTLLSGQYPFRIGHPRWGAFPRREEAETVAQLLKQAGYATAVAGKWQLTMLKDDPRQPHRMGFDHYCLFGWHEGPRYYQPMIYQNGRVRTNVRDRYGPDVYVEFLADFMKSCRNEPWFAFYSMALCHDVTDDLQQPVPYAPGKSEYDSYAEMMVQLDVHVGQIVEAVDRLGLGEETVIFFTTDNGTPKSSIYAAENGRYLRKPVYSKHHGKIVRGQKGELTNGETHVPLMVRWTGRISPGQTASDLVDMSDFLPTFTALAGMELADGFQTDGHSFSPRLLGTGGTSRQWAYSERGSDRYWVRTQQWKLDHAGRLFDMRMDPTEQRPIEIGEGSSDTAHAHQKLQRALESLGRE